MEQNFQTAPTEPPTLRRPKIQTIDNDTLVQMELRTFGPAGA